MLIRSLYFLLYTGHRHLSVRYHSNLLSEDAWRVIVQLFRTRWGALSYVRRPSPDIASAVMRSQPS